MNFWLRYGGAIVPVTGPKLAHPRRLRGRPETAGRTARIRLEFSSQTEVSVLARVGVTLAALLLALIAFLGGGPVEAGLLNPFGILFVILALLAWFAWDAVIGGYTSDGSGPDGAELPMLARFAPVFIKGVTKGVSEIGRLARTRTNGPDAPPPPRPAAARRPPQ
jgi:hypothetical protein